MTITGWIAVLALLLAALGLALRNYRVYLQTARRVHELAGALEAEFDHHEGRDRLTWRVGRDQFELSLHRTALAKIEKLKLVLRNGRDRPTCRLVRRATKVEQPAVSPHVLGHPRFDAVGRIIGITNPGVRERLLDGGRADNVVRLFKQGFDEIELGGKSVTASRQLPFDPEILDEAAVVGDWVRLLGEL